MAALELARQRLERIDQERAALARIASDEALLVNVTVMIRAQVEAARPSLADALRKIFAERRVAMRMSDLVEIATKQYRIPTTTAEIEAALRESGEYFSPGRGWWTRRPEKSHAEVAG